MFDNLSIRSLFALSWADFKREKKSLLILTVIFFLLAVSQQLFINFLSDVTNVYVIVAVGIVSLIFSWIIIIYGAVFSKNILDVVYHRQLHWFSVSPTVLKAAFVNFMIAQIATLLMLPILVCWIYFFMPEHLYLLADYGLAGIELPQNWYVIQAILLTAFAIFLCANYLFARCMFVDLFILEQKCTVSQALSLSWQATQGHFLFIVLLALAITGLLFVGLMALLVGVFVALPVVMLMRVHLFKDLSESERA